MPKIVSAKTGKVTYVSDKPGVEKYRKFIAARKPTKTVKVVSAKTGKTTFKEVPIVKRTAEQQAQQVSRVAQGLPAETTRKIVSAKTGVTTYQTIAKPQVIDFQQQAIQEAQQKVFAPSDTVGRYRRFIDTRKREPVDPVTKAKEALLSGAVTTAKKFFEEKQLAESVARKKEAIELGVSPEMEFAVDTALDTRANLVISQMKRFNESVEKENLKAEEKSKQLTQEVNALNARIKAFESKSDKEKTMSEFNALNAETNRIKQKAEAFRKEESARARVTKLTGEQLMKKQEITFGAKQPDARTKVGFIKIPAEKIKVSDVRATVKPFKKAKVPETPVEAIKWVATQPREFAGMFGESLGHLGGEVGWHGVPKEMFGFKKVPLATAKQRATLWGRAGGEFGYSALQHSTGFGTMLYLGEKIDKPKEAVLTVGTGFVIGGAVAGIAPIVAAKTQLASPHLARGVLGLAQKGGTQVVSLGVGALYVGSVGGELAGALDEPTRFRKLTREFSQEHAGFMIGAKYGQETIGGLLKPYIGHLEEEIALKALKPKSEKIARGFRELSIEMGKSSQLRKQPLGITETKGTKLLVGEKLKTVGGITEKGIKGYSKPVLSGTGAELGQVKGKVTAADLDYYQNQFRVYGQELYTSLGGKPVGKPTKISVKEKVLGFLGLGKPKTSPKLKTGELRLEQTDLATKIWGSEGKLIEIHGRPMLLENIGRVKGFQKTATMGIKTTTTGGLVVEAPIQFRMKARASIIDPTRSTKDFPHLIEVAQSMGIKPAPYLVKAAGKPLELKPTATEYFTDWLGKPLKVLGKPLTAKTFPKTTPSGYVYYKPPTVPKTIYPAYGKSDYKDYSIVKKLDDGYKAIKPVKEGYYAPIKPSYVAPTKYDFDYLKFKAPAVYKPTKYTSIDYKPYKPYKAYKPYKPYKPYDYKPYDYKPYKPYDYKPYDYKPYKPYGYKPYKYTAYKQYGYKPYDYKPYDYKPYKPYDYKPYDYKPYKPYDYKPYDYIEPKIPRYRIDTKEYQKLELKSPKKLKKELPAYAAFVKTKGEFKQISGALTYKQALVKGIVATDILGAKRTFEVRAIKGKAKKKALPFDPQKWLAKRFRKPIKGGVEQVGSQKWIEKTMYAISTGGEKREITFAPRRKKLKKKQKRSKFKNNLFRGLFYAV